MIVLYKGARGRGKTLSMVKDALRFYRNGYKILANFSLCFGEHITAEELLSLNRESDLHDCVLVIDEAQLFFDSRNFGKESNKTFSNFIQQIRKRNIFILFTTQYSNTVDLRLRQHIDIVAYPSFNKDLVLCSVKYYDLSLLEDMSWVEIQDLKPYTIVYDPKELFGLYDTTEMLK